jgi:hypothetical protein
MMGLGQIKWLGIVIIFWTQMACASVKQFEGCDDFISMVFQAKETYYKNHRIYPVPLNIINLAEQYQPIVYLSPGNKAPIDFSDYLKSAVLKDKDGKIAIHSPQSSDLSSLSMSEQCFHYLEASEVPASQTAPFYVQVFQDKRPDGVAKNWTYIKYNLTFDWSGLAKKTSWLAALGVFITGGISEHWHRLDIHTAAVLVFDENLQLRFLTLAQHNHMKTYLAGRDFPEDRPPVLVSALRSNELYLDRGENQPVLHRVVPFYNDLAYLIDENQAPTLWAKDMTYGRNAGGIKIQTRLIFLPPKHPLADYAGLLAPKNRMFGIYTGRDGPPGSNYYATPEFFALSDFVAAGYWQENDFNLLKTIQPYLKGLKDTHWSKLIQVMRQRIKFSLSNNR